MKIGSFINGGFSPLPSSAYAGLGMPLQSGQIYEARITTEYMTPEKEAQNISNLMTVKIPDVSVLGVEASGNTIRIQMAVTPSLNDADLTKGVKVSTAGIIAMLVVIVIPIMLVVLGIVNIIVSSISQITWTVVLIAGIGIGAYFLIGPGKKAVSRVAL